MTKANSLREVFNRCVDDSGSLVISLGHQRVEILFGDVLGLLVAEGVFASLAQRLAPILEQIAKGTLARAIADEPFVVFEFDVVAVDLNRG
jgi:hypothetical protein